METKIPTSEKIKDLDKRFSAAFEKWKADPRRDVTQKKSRHLGEYIELHELLKYCVGRMEKCVDEFEHLGVLNGEPQVLSDEELMKL